MGVGGGYYIEVACFPQNFAGGFVGYVCFSWNSPGQREDNSGRGISYALLAHDLKTYLKNKKGTYGVYVTDLSTGSSFGINEKEVFYAASTVKLTIALYVLNLIKKGKLNPNDTLEYKEEHFEPGTGILQTEPIGSDFPISRLLKESIVVSDNVATNILLDRVERVNVKNFMRDMGGRVVDNSNNTTCPVDMANYMFEVLLFTSMEPELGGTLMDYLYNTEFNECIPASLPKGMPVAHKIGTWPPTGTYNDVTYVEHPLRPYIISVFSKDIPSAAEAFGVIKYISRAVYDYQEQPDYYVEIFFNGRRLPLKDSAVQCYHDKQVFVPLREVVKHIPGLGIYWDGVTCKIGIASFFTRNQVTYFANDENILIIDGVSYIPLHVLAKDLSYNIAWDVGSHRFFLNDGMYSTNLFVTLTKET